MNFISLMDKLNIILQLLYFNSLLRILKIGDVQKNRLKKVIRSKKTENDQKKSPKKTIFTKRMNYLQDL